MFTITSLDTPDYNCIAWAAEEDHRFWWPDVMNTSYWPKDAPREVSLEAFIEAFRTLGYEPCESGELEQGFQKVVIYSKSGKPTHAARQLPKGEWASKLGKSVDIEHDTPEEVTRYPGCAQYGMPVQFLKRQHRPPIQGAV